MTPIEWVFTIVVAALGLSACAALIAVIVIAIRAIKNDLL